MQFHIGDQVVHPQYGVGQVVKLEDREFDPGVTRRYYEVSIPGGSTVWVPLDLLISGLRKVARKSEIAACRKIILAPPAPLAEDMRVRQSDLSTRMKRGTIASHCEVVRDLSAHGDHKPVTGSVASLLQAAQRVLCQEWALVEGITQSEATAEVEGLLEKCRQSKMAAQAV
jgi:RNA polymerase-interacting CarD/CdnL/TRCF family regulator